MANVLCIATHPDDETLGCGGTLLKHKAERDDIYWLIMTVMQTKYGWKKDVVCRREKEIADVEKKYRFSKVYRLGFPTMRLDTIPMAELVSSVAEVINGIRPAVVYLPYSSDVHTDHRITFQAGYSCIKSFRFPFVRGVSMYETISETEFAPALPGSVFTPNLFVNVTDYLSRKIEIMKIYKSEIMAAPYPRSIEAIKALAKFRGSRIGKKYAEAFMMIYQQR